MARSILLTMSIAALAVLPAAQALAGPITVDGRVLASESYYSWTVDTNQNDGNGDPIQTTIYLAQDARTFDVYAAVVLSADRVDNSYGKNQVGWPGNNHNFDKLLKSDKAQFVFKDNGSTVLDATMDFLFETPKGGGVYSSGWGNKSSSPRDDKVDSSVAVGNVANIEQAASSLDYDLNTVIGGDYTAKNSKGQTQDYTVDSPITNGSDTYAGSDVSDWVFEVVYEFQVAGTMFNELIIDQNGFRKNWSFVVAGLHASPYKTGCDKNLIPGAPTGTPTPPGGIVPTGSVVPLPSGVWVGMLLLAGLGIMRIRRRRLSASRN